MSNDSDSSVITGYRGDESRWVSFLRSPQGSLLYLVPTAFLVVGVVQMNPWFAMDLESLVGGVFGAVFAIFVGNLIEYWDGR